MEFYQRERARDPESAIDLQFPDKGLVETVMAGGPYEKLPPQQKAMLTHVEKLTVAPSSVSEADIATLRTQGFSDLAILEINAAAAYMNFVNRVALGLGVELEKTTEKFSR